MNDTETTKTAPDIALLEFIRNPEVIWYGPHGCNGCGHKIIKSSAHSGGVELDAEDFNHNYPNFKWERHVCRMDKPQESSPEVGS